MRNIEDILLFRGDISPFLAHLTRDLDGMGAEDRLRQILQTLELRAGASHVSDARFGGVPRGISMEAQRRMFAAVCFTETPLAEIHCLLDIRRRVVNLAPYGLVFVKDRLKTRGVSPVLYLNNERGDIEPLMQALYSLKEANPAAAEQLFPLIGVFGQKIRGANAAERPAGRVDFAWEREWRYPYANGPFQFTLEDVFCGLCPHDEITAFETEFPGLKFIDPTRYTKWYADALLACRERLNLRNPVV